MLQLESHFVSLSCIDHEWIVLRQPDSSRAHSWQNIFLKSIPYLADKSGYMIKLNRIILLSYSESIILAWTAVNHRWRRGHHCSLTTVILNTPFRYILPNQESNFIKHEIQMDRVSSMRSMSDSYIKMLGRNFLISWISLVDCSQLPHPPRTNSRWLIGIFCSATG